jgi:hypothetical protein
MTLARFETTIPASVRPHNHVLGRATTRIGTAILHKPVFPQVLEKYTDLYGAWKFSTVGTKRNWERPEELIRGGKEEEEKEVQEKVIVQSVKLNLRLYEICNMNEMLYEIYLIYAVNKMLLLRGSY